MANFTKAFNFRGGFQVDTDVLVVRGQQVGIGSTVPQQVLDVNGIVRARGLEVSSLDPVAIQSATVGFLSASLIHSGVTSITNGIITATSPAGVVTYYGDGGRLLNLPTSQWLDVDVGLGFTSIYAQGNVGVDTNDPRYVFQVGGVPAPKGNQTGVGIEDGNIFASGNIEAAGDFVIGGEVDITGSVAVAGTVTADQFVGFGSGIQLLNASNLGVGSIPSNRYGDTIITGTVFGDLVGVAQSAASLLTDADITFDSATVRLVEVTERLFSPNGKLQVGDDNTPAVGDVDVRKTSGNAEIYSISDIGSAQVFAGTQRPGGSNISYGGIRFGGNVPGAPESKINDLDLVNYDVGNLNYYLHGSTTGLSTGSFQWIYGRGGNRILATLDRFGGFTLAGHSTATSPTLDVTGISTFRGDVFIDDSLEVGRNSIFRSNLDVEGDLTLTGSIGITTDSLDLPRTTFNGDVIVGDEPEVGGGVAISTSGELRANSIKVMNGLTTAFSVTQGGAIDAQGIGCTGLNAEILVETPRIVGQDYSGANGFFNTAAGAGFQNLAITSTLSAATASFTALSVANISPDTVTTNNLIVDTISLTQGTAAGGPVLDITNPISTPAIFTNTINISENISIQIGIGTGALTFTINDNGVIRVAEVPFLAPPP